MALTLATAANASRTPQTLDTQEFSIPIDTSEYAILDANITMPDKAAGDANLKLDIRFQVYDESAQVWKTGPAIEWVGGVINPKTGEYYRPGLTETLSQFAGKKVKLTISVSKTASIGFNIKLV